MKAVPLRVFSDPLQQIIARKNAYEQINAIEIKSNLTFGEFVTLYAFVNIPVIFQIDLMQWEISKWAIGPSTINLTEIKRIAGNDKVSVANCNTKYFSDQLRSDSTVGSFCDEWEINSRECKYLKDWHVFRDHPDLCLYQVPAAFGDDWLDFHWKKIAPDDFRFIYFGSAKTWTPLHVDVFASYSWSVNVVGTKKWYLFPPDLKPLMSNSKGDCPYNIHTVDILEFPNFNLALEKCIIVDQPPGTAIFVPSMWFHQVENLTDCLSLNANWNNGICIDLNWLHLLEEALKVENALKHLKPACHCFTSVTFKLNNLKLCDNCTDYIETVWSVTRANAGIDLFTFSTFLEFCAEQQIEMANALLADSGFPIWISLFSADEKKLMISLTLLGLKKLVFLFQEISDREIHNHDRFSLLDQIKSRIDCITFLIL